MSPCRLTRTDGMRRSAYRTCSAGSPPGPWNGRRKLGLPCWLPRNDPARHYQGEQETAKSGDSHARHRTHLSHVTALAVARFRVTSCSSLGQATRDRDYTAGGFNFSIDARVRNLSRGAASAAFYGAHLGTPGRASFKN